MTKKRFRLTGEIILRVHSHEKHSSVPPGMMRVKIHDEQNATYTWVMLTQAEYDALEPEVIVDDAH